MSTRPRLVLLGASNLVRGLRAATEEAWRQVTPPADLFVAAGHGRSYGVTSSMLGRRLPSILECGLWPALDQAGSGPVQALLTDLGNDVMYGAPVAQIVEWVRTAVTRLEQQGADIVLVGLPLARLDRVTRAQYQVIRALLYPTRRVSFGEALGRCRELDARLEALAREHGLTWVQPDPGWYGMDPIHPRRRHLPDAWRNYLTSWQAAAQADSAQPDCATARVPRLWFRPEQKHWFRWRRNTPQPALRLPQGNVSFF